MIFLETPVFTKLIKALMDDEAGLAANLIDAAGGDRGRAIEGVNREFYKIPKVEGQGAGQLYLAPESARLFDQAEQLAEKAGVTKVYIGQLERGERNMSPKLRAKIAVILDVDNDDLTPWAQD